LGLFDGFLPREGIVGDGDALLSTSTWYYV
jgi:hypothetical protein